MTEEPGRLRRAMETIDRAAKRTSEGCRILGINMEGPFLSPAKKGAHDEQYLKAPSAELLETLDALSGHRIKLVDLAPELPGGMDFIRQYAGKKVLSLAHTGIGYDEAIAAFDAGANHVTHLFNAMNDPNTANRALWARCATAKTSLPNSSATASTTTRPSSA